MSDSEEEIQDLQIGDIVTVYPDEFYQIIKINRVNVKVKLLKELLVSYEERGEYDRWRTVRAQKDNFEEDKHPDLTKIQILRKDRCRRWNGQDITYGCNDDC